MRARRNQGFTLVEAIVVLVLTGILAGVTVLFIRRPVQAYVDSAARAEMTDVAEIALRRMSRELHGALPNSIRFTVINNVSYLEFIPTKAGGIYLSVNDSVDPSKNVIPLDFVGAGTSFDIVGPVPVAPYAIAAGDSIVVYNLGTGFTNSDAYAQTPGNRATVTGIAGTRVSYSGPNPFAIGGYASNSPRHRFAVATSPVTFACANNATTGRGTLTRFWNYGFMPNQGNPATQSSFNSALMAANVYGCQFSVQQAANQQTALVGLAIALARPNPEVATNALETVTLVQQIHVDNTP
jgi:MSHA biogenesis protein MshO